MVAVHTEDFLEETADEKTEVACNVQLSILFPYTVKPRREEGRILICFGQ